MNSEETASVLERTKVVAGSEQRKKPENPNKKGPSEMAQSL
jgi:hypothetical protein